MQLRHSSVFDESVIARLLFHRRCQNTVTFLLVLLIISGQALACAAEHEAINASEAKRYLLRALRIIRKQAIYSNKINFAVEKKKALRLTKDARAPKDTYPVIRAVLAKLPGRHSALVIPESELAEAKVSADSRKSAQYKLPVPANQLSPAGQMLRHGAQNIGYLLVPGLIAYDEATLMHYAERLRSILAELNKAQPHGWIVDLRRNTGGNNWPMLAALGPLLGHGVIGHFCSPRAKTCAWIYEDDKISVTSSSRKWLPYPLSAAGGGEVQLCDFPPVAVLIGKNTISAGEIVAIAFKGRPNTRFFGENTAGLTTAVKGYELIDHAVLFLAVEEDADRNGNRYPDGIHPDELTMQGEQTQKDPVVESATNWISKRVFNSGN